MNAPKKDLRMKVKYISIFFIALLGLSSIVIIYLINTNPAYYNAYLKVLTKAGITKSIIMSDSGINKNTDSQETIAIKLRDFVFRTTKRGQTPRDITEPYQRYFFAHYTPPLVQVCSGYVTEMRFLLSQFNIPSREIALFARSFFEGQTGNSHAVLEVFLSNKWVFMDPTFNCHWNCSDGKNMLSFQEIHACLSTGNDLVIQEGLTKIPGYALKDYYMDFKDFIYGYKTVGADGKFGDFQFFDPIPNFGTNE